ncbi:MAG: DUF6088 family protein [Burkholderiales bacterium]
MGKHAQSIDTQIFDRIKRNAVGQVFNARDFLDLGSRHAVDQTLSRHSRAGRLRKVARGLYDVPRIDPQLGQLSPNSDAIANALKSRDGIRLQPTGAHAANMLGLSDQVPVKIVYLTDGSSRHLTYGGLDIVLKHTTTRNMATAGRLSGLIIQALRWMGRNRVDDDIVAKLRRNLKPNDRAALVRDVAYAPAWIARIFHRLASDNQEISADSQ